MEDAKSIDTDVENATPETSYFKMMMQDNEIGRVITGNDNTDNDSLIGGQTIASLMDGSKIFSGIKSSNSAAESYTQSTDPNQNSGLAIVGYDDVSDIGNDTVNESTKEFFTGNGDREDTKPRIRLFKEYKNKKTEYKTPEKKKKSTNPFDDDEATQPETPPGVIQVPSSDKSTSAHEKEEKTKKFSLRSKRVYIVAGVLALVLFVSIIALAIALRGVRGKETSGSSSSAINSDSEEIENVILDLWPDLDTTIETDDKGSVEDVVEESPVPEPTKAPIETTQKPIDTPVVVETTQEPTNAPTNAPVVGATQEPTMAPVETKAPTVSPTTLSPTTLAPVTSAPTAGPDPQVLFNEALTLLTERDAINAKEIEKNPDGPQNQATIWLSQDPDFSGYTQDRLVQRWSLAVLAQSLDPTFVVENPSNARKLQDGDGSNLLSGWVTYTDECTWFTSSTTNSTCDQDGMIQTIDLQDMMLGGTLPTELALLSNSLQHIVLDGNDLEEEIPKELGVLTNLVTMRLRRNNLKKDLKIDLGQLVNLEILDLGKNKLSGNLPDKIANLNSLTELYLDDNEFSGNIPWNIGGLDTLTTLALADNSLTGWIPDSLGDLENLKVLTLGDNFLTGTLPSAVCELGDLDVVNVDCVEQGCECCTSCSSTEAPTSSPTTSSPTTSPPTLPPASLFEPTSPPVLQAPTISPVDCLAEISVEDFCFAPSANIGVSLTNCNERRDDWVGVYRVVENFDKNNLANPELWTWACGTRNCREAVTQNTIPLSTIHGENDKWPLPEGIYIAILSRNTAQPYKAYAISETFVIAEQC